LNNRILVVEDDDNLRISLVDNLELEGYKVFSSATVKDSKEILVGNNIDLIVLDIMLPDGNGFDLCQWVREKEDVLIIMLTAKGLEKDLVQGFISGTDDYMSKPYRSTELLLRIKALLRRKTCRSILSEQQINGFNIDWKLRKVTSENKDIHLTKTAFDILSYLVENTNKISSRDEILNAVWGVDVFVDNRTIDNFVSNIKKQLNFVEGADYQINSVRGIGYSLVKN